MNSVIIVSLCYHVQQEETQKCLLLGKKRQLTHKHIISFQAQEQIQPTINGICIVGGSSFFCLQIKSFQANHSVIISSCQYTVKLSWKWK